jgi:hypothetical protein
MFVASAHLQQNTFTHCRGARVRTCCSSLLFAKLSPLLALCFGCIDLCSNESAFDTACDLIAKWYKTPSSPPQRLNNIAHLDLLAVGVRPVLCNDLYAVSLVFFFNLWCIGRHIVVDIVCPIHRLLRICQAVGTSVSVSSSSVVLLLPTLTADRLP